MRYASTYVVFAEHTERFLAPMFQHGNFCIDQPIPFKARGIVCVDRLLMLGI